ncbi:MAG: NADH:ubiquinone reductase (Na(+)-transporting) subunit F, partial [bacterium]
VETVTHVSSLISEIVLCMPDGEVIDFDSGGFVEITCPPYQLSFSDLEVDEKYRGVWKNAGLHLLQAGTAKPVTRAYSMANRPGENHCVRLNIRVAVPPPGKIGIPPGVVSSWLFSLKQGDQVEVSGPYGYFFVEESPKEAIFIGGGVGMAPLYSQILDLLHTRKTDRKVSYWYGARSKRELYYHEEFEQLDQQFDNFSWHVVLSEPESDDRWEGLKGFVHNAIYDDYLSTHHAPEDCEYYLCGPPLMVKAVLSMLDDLGVDLENIHYDDFGGG